MSQALVVWESMKKSFLGEPRQRGGKGLGVVKWFCQAGTEATESEARVTSGEDFTYQTSSLGLLL